MKKIISVFVLFSITIFITSCEYDDSNDIDILKPIDSTDTGVTVSDAPN